MLNLVRVANWVKLGISEKITPEMEDLFKKRTAKHIALVQKYCKKIYDLYPIVFRGIIERGEKHDESKFKEPERTPYVFITWDYHCQDTGEKFDIPEDFREEMDRASEYHVKKNRHHPEFHCKKTENIINRENREEPLEEAIDATRMSMLDIAEMVADWCAMSEEKGTNTPEQWADKNINVRWNFTNDQVDFIYDLIEQVWK